MSKFPCRPLPEVRLVLDSVIFSQGKASPHWNMGTEQCWAWSQEPGTQVQVLAFTVLLGAQLSDSVSSCRVVWRQHVLLCPEYLEPGLVWEKEHAITGYQHKWGKQVSTVLTRKMEARSSFSGPLQSSLPVPVESPCNSIICFHPCLHYLHFCALREALRLI